MTAMTLATMFLIMTLLAVVSAETTCVDPVENCDPTTTNYFPVRVSFNYLKLVSKPTYTNSTVEFSIINHLSEKTRKYMLVRCGCPTPELTDAETNVINVPVKDLYVHDTISLASLTYDLDGGLDKVRYIHTDFYVSSTQVRTAVRQGKIIATDPAQGTPDALPYDKRFTPFFNKEVVPERPSLALIGTFDEDDFKAAAKADNKKFPSSPEQTFLVATETGESNPLGKAEYVRLFGLLIGNVVDGDKEFRRIERSYKEAANAARRIRRRPSVLLNVPLKDFEGKESWILPAGNVHASQLVRDANADYRFQNLETEGSSIDLTYDQLLTNFSSATFWINAVFFTPPASNITALDEAAKAQGFAKMNELESVRCDNVWANDKDQPFEGNNYFEQGVVQPDLVLKDLIKLFHPGSLPEHKFKFYRKLPRGNFKAPACRTVELASKPGKGLEQVRVPLALTNVDRFTVERKLYSGVKQAIVKQTGVPAGKTEITLRTLETSKTSTFANVTLEVAEDDVDNVIEKSADLPKVVADSLNTNQPQKNVVAKLEGNITSTREVDGPSGAGSDSPGDTESEDGEGDGGLSGGAIAGIVVGSGVVLVGVLGLLVFASGRNRNVYA